MPWSAVPSRMIASASLERWTEIEGLIMRFRTHRVSGDPPKQSAPATQTPSTGRAFGPTVESRYWRATRRSSRYRMSVDARASGSASAT